MKHLYVITISINLSCISTVVDNLEKVVNKSMKYFGFEENMVTVSEFDIRMTSSRELNKEDIAKVETVLINEMSKSFGKGKIRIKDISYLGSYN